MNREVSYNLYMIQKMFQNPVNDLVFFQLLQMASYHGQMDIIHFLFSFLQTPNHSIVDLSQYPDIKSTRRKYIQLFLNEAVKGNQFQVIHMVA